MKKLVAAMTVLVAVAACAGCSTSAPDPAPAPAPNPAPKAPAPASGEQLISEADLDGDGKGDAIYGVPRPQFTTYTSIRVVAASGETLLALNSADGDLLGPITAAVHAPTPVFVTGHVGTRGDDLLTAYLYDKATRQMVPVKWAGKELHSPLVGRPDVDGRGSLTVDVPGQVRGPVPYVYKDGAMAPLYEL